MTDLAEFTDSFTEICAGYTSWLKGIGGAPTLATDFEHVCNIMQATSAVYGAEEATEAEALAIVIGLTVSFLAPPLIEQLITKLDDWNGTLAPGDPLRAPIEITRGVLAATLVNLGLHTWQELREDALQTEANHGLEMFASSIPPELLSAHYIYQLDRYEYVTQSSIGTLFDLIHLNELPFSTAVRNLAGTFQTVAATQFPSWHESATGWSSNAAHEGVVRVSGNEIEITANPINTGIQLTAAQSSEMRGALAVFASTATTWAMDATHELEPETYSVLTTFAPGFYTAFPTAQIEALHFIRPEIVGFADYLGGSNLGDFIFNVTPASTIEAGAGSDIVIYRSRDGIDITQTVHGNEGNDVISTGGGADHVFGDAGNDVVFGGADNDELYGGAGDDFLVGDTGTDLFSPGDGANLILGGEGFDTADYQDVVGGLRIDADLEAMPGWVSTTSWGPAARFNAAVYKVATQETDYVFDVENFLWSQSGDELRIKGMPVPQGNGSDLFFFFRGGYDKADFSELAGSQGASVNLKNPEGGKIAFGQTSLFATRLEDIVGSSQDDTIYGADSSNLSPGDREYQSILDGGAGDDTIIGGRAKTKIIGGEGVDDLQAFGYLSHIDAGDGNDIIRASVAGTRVDLGSGSDTVYLGLGVGIFGAGSDDIVYGHGGFELHGGWKWEESESPWARGIGGYKYALNVDGELVIRMPGDPGSDGETYTYIADYNDGLDGGERTADILVFEIEVSYYGILWGNAHGAIDKTMNVFYAMWKALTSNPWKPGVDPIVLDLDGDGLELTASDARKAPYFDLDSDGFAEKTGWVGADDALLAWDINMDGEITTAEELFGNGPDSFVTLSALDSNSDGIISALDLDFTSLRVWRDLDHDAKTDAGELQSLSQAGIASISLATTNSNDIIGDNTVVKAGTFTRADGSTGTAGGVVFTLDQAQTIYAGDTTVSAAAAALPELKGYGNLPNLRISMTEHASLLTLVETIVPGLTDTTLSAVRAEVKPILEAWAAAEGFTADAVVLAKNASGDLVDFAYFDAGAGLWYRGSDANFASGVAGVATQQEAITYFNSYANVASTSVLSGAERAYMEALYGTPLPIGEAEGNDDVDGVGDLLGLMADRVDGAAVRMLVQGPLASTIFSDISYDVAMDRFVADTPRGLVPVFEEILEASEQAGNASSYLEGWSEILYVLLSDYSRGQSHLKVTADYLFANLVAAYENVGAPIALLDAADALGVPTDKVIIGAPGTTNGTINGDIFYLKSGDETVSGGSGKDVYVIGRNFGHDVIEDHEYPLNGAADIIRFAHLNPSDITVTRVGTDAVITVIATGDTLTIKKQFESGNSMYQSGDLRPSHGVDEISFANGTVWDQVDIAWAAASTPDSAGTTITGDIGEDVLNGGAGNDTLIGKDAGDVYVFGLGDGQDTINDGALNLNIGGPDTVVFGTGIDLEDLQFDRNADSDDLLITVGTGGDTLTIIDQFWAMHTVVAGVHFFDQIDVFSFADGIRLFATDIMDILMEQATTSGNDAIYGFYRADFLDGGTGDDFLSGSDDADTYFWGTGSGHDTIHDKLTDLLTESRKDKIIFSPDLTPGEVHFGRTGNSMNLTVSLSGAQDTLTVVDQFQTLDSGPFGQQWFDRIEEFVFADGTVKTWSQVMQEVVANGKTTGDDVIYGFEFDDVLDGGYGNDVLYGKSKDDIYIFGHGYGHDIVDENVTELLFSNFDIVQFTADVLVSDIVLLRGVDQDDLVIQIIGTGDTLTVRDTFFTSESMTHDYVEAYHFADGTIWSLEDVKVQLLASEQTTGNDLVRGFDDRDDILDGGTGNDRLEGEAGNDTYVFDRGYGADTILDKGIILGGGAADKVLFGSGVATDDVVLQRSGNNLTVRIKNPDGTLSNDSLTIEKMFYPDFTWYRIESFQFADGTIWTYSDIQDRLLMGTAASETLEGFDRPDVLDGGAGDDLLIGHDGDDTYKFGYGYGSDRIEEHAVNAASTNFDTVEFGAGILPGDLSFSRVGSDIIVILPGGADRLTLAGQLSQGVSYNRIEQFLFADGTTWDQATILANSAGMTGTSGDDTLIGSVGNEILEGLGGNDNLQGKGGSDTYIYGAGDGDDILYDQGSSAKFDVLQLGEGIDPSQAVLSRVSGGSTTQADIVLSFTNMAGSIYINQQFGSANDGLEEIAFADGTRWNEATMASLAIYRGTSGADTIQAGTFDDIVEGYDGNDTLSGNAGHDTIHGGSGADTISGTTGNDQLFGDDGADDITGGDQNDIIQGGTGDDILSGNNHSDQLFGGDGDDTLILVIGLSGDVDHYDGGAGIDTLDFVSGTTAARTIDLGTGTFQNDTFVGIENVTTYSGADTVTGDGNANVIITNNGADSLIGEGGNDHLEAGAGNDTLRGGTGADVYIGGSGNDTFWFETGLGQDVVNDFAAGSAVSDVLRLQDLGVSSLSQVLAISTQVGADTIISFDADNSITLLNVTKTNLHTNDFLFS